MTDAELSRRQPAPGGQAGLSRTSFLVGAAVLVAAIVAGVFILSDSGLFGDGGDSPVDSNRGGGVSIPQEPSLRLFLEEGTYFVENDGNVTMSEVEVRDGSGGVLCALGVLSPGDRPACDAASGVAGLSAHGIGPQGQQVQDTID